MAQSHYPPNNSDNVVPSIDTVKEYVDNQIDRSLDFKQVCIDAKEITMSFDYPNTEMLLNKMNKRSLEVLQAHLKELQLHVEKRLFEKT